MSDSHSHHIVPIKTYFGVLVILFVLMGLTIFVYEVHFTDNSYINNAIAMTIAIIKATLVIAVFMGVKYGTKLTKMWAITGFVWFFLMFLMYCDYMTRSWEPVAGWEAGAETALPRGPYVPPAKDQRLMSTDEQPAALGD